MGDATEFQRRIVDAAQVELDATIHSVLAGIDRGRNMKKFFSLLIIVIMSSACTPKATPTSAPPTATVVQPTPTPQGKTLLVNSPADGGPGTLRQAMLDAQNGDTFTFDPSAFPPDAPVTIFALSELPHIRWGMLFAAETTLPDGASLYK